MVGSGEYVDVTITTEGLWVPPVEEGVSVTVAVTATTLGLEVGVGVVSTTVVEGGIETEEMLVGVGVGVVSGLLEVSGVEAVTVYVVVGEVVKLIEVLVMILVCIEPSGAVLVAVAVSASRSVGNPSTHRWANSTCKSSRTCT